MVFCTNCGEELPENAYFCVKCGVRTTKGKEENVPPPREDWRDAFTQVGKELDKAFTTAAKEIEKAFQTAREEFRKATSRETVVCKHCGARNSAEGRFCTGCGKEL